MSEEARTDWDSYPTGLKVLAVDDDPLCLKVVEQMLRRCNYQVRTAENGKDALAKLRDKNLQIDLVLSDVYMPDMDGFKLLETIGLELDLPVIMMSSNGDTPVVLRGVTHGAVDFLIKPVRIEELRNVWQHVVRRRKDQAHTSQQYSGDEEVVDGSRQDKKRKEVRRDSDDQASTKKPRVVWSVEMHQQFVNAVNSLGIDKAVPKRILDLMNVEGLTRENVASHLQKYRLYLKRVAGVQVQPSGRSKASHNSSAESQQTFAPLMVGPPVGPGGLGMTGSDSLSDQDQLKVQLQMQQMHNQQVLGGQPVASQQQQQQHFCKQEPLMMVSGPGAPPYSNGNSLCHPDFNHIPPGLTPVCGALDTGVLRGSAGAAGLLPISEGGGYENATLPGMAHQAYNVTGIPALSSAELMYPDPLLPSHHTGLDRLQLPQEPHPDELHQPPSGLDLSHDDSGLANGHQEQEMENFINIFLQPND